MQLHDGDETHLGDAIVYAELNDGGKIFYVWFRLLEGPYAEVLLYDVFNFLHTQLR
jgi:hypothetical protein